MFTLWGVPVLQTFSKRLIGYEPGSQVTFSSGLLSCDTSLHVFPRIQCPGNSRRDAKHMVKTLNHPARAFPIAGAQSCQVTI